MRLLVWVGPLEAAEGGYEKSAGGFGVETWIQSLDFVGTVEKCWLWFHQLILKIESGQRLVLRTDELQGEPSVSIAGVNRDFKPALGR